MSIVLEQIRKIGVAVVAAACGSENGGIVGWEMSLGCGGSGRWGVPCPVDIGAWMRLDGVGGMLGDARVFLERLGLGAVTSP